MHLGLHTWNPHSADYLAGSKEQRRRIHLSLRLSRLALGLTSSALVEGACLPGCVTSVEDHGYLLMFGIQVLSSLRAQAMEPESQ